MMVEFTPPLVAFCRKPHQLQPGHFARDKAVRDRNPNQGIGAQSGRCRRQLAARRRQICAYRADAFAGARVAFPFIAECYANLECKIVDRVASTYSISLCWRSSRLGSIPLAKARRRRITVALANSSSMERSSKRNRRSRKSCREPAAVSRPDSGERAEARRSWASRRRRVPRYRRL